MNVDKSLVLTWIDAVIGKDYLKQILCEQSVRGLRRQRTGSESMKNFIVAGGRTSSDDTQTRDATGED